MTTGQTGLAQSNGSKYTNGEGISQQTTGRTSLVDLTPKPTVIGVIIPRFDSPSTALTLKGIDCVAQDKGYQVLVANCHQKVDQEVAAIYRFAHEKVAGIIWLAGQITSQHLDALDESGLPAVVVGQEHERLYSVVHDDYQAGYEMGQAIVGLGHQHVTYIGVPEEDRAVGRIRKAGVINGLREAGARGVEVLESDFSSESAVARGEQLLAEHRRTVLIAATDTMAIGLLKAASNLGVSVPNQVCIAGFGGYDLGNYVHPTLSTVQYQFQKAGATAMVTLVNLINEVATPRVTLMPVKLKLRQSTTQVRKMKKLKSFL